MGQKEKEIFQVTTQGKQMIRIFRVRNTPFPALRKQNYLQFTGVPCYTETGLETGQSPGDVVARIPSGKGKGGAGLG